MSRTPVLAAGAAPAAPASRSKADDVTPMLLEFQSPSAALIEQKVPANSRYTLWVLASTFLVALALMAAVPIDRVVMAQGKLVTTTRHVVIQPLETSIVRSIDVREGEVVKTGQLLARLDQTFVAADADALESQVSSLQAEVDRLRAEVDGLPYVGDGTPPSQLQSLIFTQRNAERSFRLENYRQRIDGVQVRVAQAMADVESYTTRLAVARQVEGMRVELERQAVGSRLNTFQAQLDRNEAGRLLDTARSQAVSGQREMQALMAERDSYVQQARNESTQQLTDQGRKLSEASENLTKARMRRGLVELRADRDSVVLSVAPVSVGSVMQTAEQFLTLVPVDAPLEIEAMVDGRDAGFVGAGDPVTIKFDTFPYAIYGTADGTVRILSPDSFRNPNEDRTRQMSRGRAGTEDFGNAYYRARMTIDTMKLRHLPEGFRLSPGMPVTADIKIGKRTVLAFLFSRIVPVTQEGLREP